MTTIPEKPSLDGLEAKWGAAWQQRGSYRFDAGRPRDEVYSIDTPPPTVSGELHLGTAFGYIQVDALARYQRMRGKTVFYPMGWDDNGLPTERRVQAHYGVRCDPSVPYDPGLEVSPRPASERAARPRPVSRRNFVELCQRLVAELEESFERQVRSMGLSVDWRLAYATIDDRSRRTAQRAFLRNLRRGEAYAGEAPTMWDVDFQTAVAQAELEDREVAGAYHRLAFARAAGARRHHPAGAAALVRGPGRPPGRRALPRAGRRLGDQPGVRCAGAGAGAPARRARQGHRDRDGLHLRRHRRRGVVARARPAAAGRRAA